MKTQKIEFNYKGEDHKFSFKPTEPDEWTSFKSKGLEFDVHYDEEYNHIVVYEVVDGKAQTNNTVYKKALIPGKPFSKGGVVVGDFVSITDKKDPLYKYKGKVESIEGDVARVFTVYAPKSVYNKKNAISIGQTEDVRISHLRKLEESMGKGGKLIVYDDGFSFKEVSVDYARKNWKKEEIYELVLDEQTEHLVKSEDDISDEGTYGLERGYAEGKIPKMGKGGLAASAGKLKELKEELADYELLVSDPSVPKDEKEYAEGEIPRLKKEIEALQTSRANAAAQAIIDGGGGKKTSKKTTKEKPSTKTVKATKKLDYNCDDLIKDARERATKRRAAAAKKAKEPKKTEATKNVEKIAKVADRVETNIEKRISKGEVSKSELEKLINETEELLNKLKQALKKM